MIVSHRLKAVVLLGILWALSIQSGALHAQQATPVHTISLALNETVTGRLSGQSSVTYSLEMPANQDVVIALDADHVILDRYCMQITSQDTQMCQSEGGGGDGPISITRLLPANPLITDSATLEITLSRPLETPARYSLTAYPVRLQTLVLGESIEVAADEVQPYQVYTLDIDQTEPFTITIKENTEAGAFLWAAYEIHMADIRTQSATYPLYPVWLDGASTDDAEDSLARLQILSFGGDVVYVLVEARSAHTLHANPMQIQPLAENTPLSLSLSYLVPMQVMLIDTEQGDTANIALSVTEGSGAIVRVYAEANMQISSLALGGFNATGTQFPLSGTIERLADTDGPLYLVVHIPFDFTRESLTVEVDWQRINE